MLEKFHWIPFDNHEESFILPKQAQRPIYLLKREMTSSMEIGGAADINIIFVEIISH